MSVSFTSRRAVRSLAARNVDWNSPIFKRDPEVIGAVNDFKAWVAKAEAKAEQFASPPPAIDFEATKKDVRDKSLVDSLEKFYKASKPPPMTYEWSAEDKASSLQQIEEAKSREAFTAELIEDAEKEIAYLKANRTTREMSFTEIAEAYPDLADQVEAELDNREWFKDYIIK
eukprot:CAMPEP_0202507034 /NCGR_PEP_ID=MMETSP1361-20130828/51508_1 /ASSEMBLY_ACC=CAM_ASM_000849 /TAXON_ID=210615 /ORGANISM="Staurosira complex sp., Strain CCMP2646" /LENGTH=171 /DNA_ID=CAMNT_0049141125 /DNA_START=392 /DNA_END=907 /DNA_ORIENTATION=-